MWMKSMDSMSGATLGDNPLGKIYCIEDMVIALLASSGRPGTESVAKAQVTAQLDGSQWEYIPATTYVEVVGGVCDLPENSESV